MKYDVATPYTACYILFKRDNEVAFVLRSGTGWMDGYYGPPSGKVEHNESMLHAAVREAKEEVGADITESSLRHVLTLHRKSEDDSTLWIDAYFEVITWEGELYNAEPDKHGELTWFDISQLPNNIIPSVQFSLQEIIQGHTFAQFGWDNNTAHLG
jgi:8-oxo-dGTP pyrophosphatase MutT (NUDIX family)